MVRKFYIVWKIDNFSKFIENIKKENPTSEITSPNYSFSPDEKNHLWNLSFILDSFEKREYGVYLNLVGNPTVAVSKFGIKLTDFKNNCFYKRTSTKHLNFGYFGWKSSISHDVLEARSMDFTETIKMVCYVEFAESHNPESKFLEEYKTSTIGVNLFEQCEENYTDVTITCGSEQFKAHKFVLRTASKVFDEIFKVKEESQSSSSVEVAVDGVPSDVFKGFLKFVYSGQVSINYSTSKELIEVAGRYKVQKLEDFCFEEMRKNLDDSTAVEILILADQYGKTTLKQEIFEYMKLHFVAVLNSQSWKENMIEHSELMDSIIRHIHL